MLKKIYGAALIGTKGVLVRCEADVEQGFPTITFIGSLAASVREAADRVRTALGNSGFHLEPRRVTLNLSPAELRKEGCAYDLPIAVLWRTAGKSAHRHVVCRRTLTER